MNLKGFSTNGRQMHYSGVVRYTIIENDPEDGPGYLVTNDDFPAEGFDGATLSFCINGIENNAALDSGEIDKIRDDDIIDVQEGIPMLHIPFFSADPADPDGLCYYGYRHYRITEDGSAFAVYTEYPEDDDPSGDNYVPGETYAAATLSQAFAIVEALERGEEI